ncbi:MAG: putative lipoprotein [Caudoviricetes sp.]|nr:MAG: putative lipoprotein [Caudoviricetes sp.]
MKKILVIIGAAFVLTGCTGEIEGADPGAPASPWVRFYDKAEQAKAFKECMQVLPAGPKETVYNDWDEVVDSCRSAAREQATFFKRHIGNGVWVTMEQWEQMQK